MCVIGCETSTQSINVCESLRLCVSVQMCTKWFNEESKAEQLHMPQSVDFLICFTSSLILFYLFIIYLL